MSLSGSESESIDDSNSEEDSKSYSLVDGLNSDTSNSDIDSDSDNSNHDNSFDETKNYIIIKLKKIKKLSVKRSICLKCDVPFKKRDVCCLLPCYHLLHSNCFNNWMMNNNSCPICGIKVNPD